MTELVTKTDLDATRRVADADMRNLELRLTAAIDAVRHRVNTWQLRLTIRLGGRLTIAVAIVAALIKF